MKRGKFRSKRRNGWSHSHHDRKRWAHNQSMLPKAFSDLMAYIREHDIKPPTSIEFASDKVPYVVDQFKEIIDE